MSGEVRGCSANLGMQDRRLFVLNGVLAQDWSGLAFVDAASPSEAEEAHFYLIELAGGEDVVILWRKCLELGFGAANAVVVHRVRGKRPGNEAMFLLFARIDLLEEIDERCRIVAGSVLVLHTEKVGFALGVAAELKERHRHGKAGNLANRHGHRASNEYQRQR